MTNPYTPPKTDSNQSGVSVTMDVVARIRRPANAIIFLAVANLGFDVHGFVDEIFFPTPPRLLSLGFPELAILVTSHSLQAIGGLQMRTIGSYRIACIGAVACCVPCMSPFWILGIPFGIWAIRVLSQPESKVAFNHQHR